MYPTSETPKAQTNTALEPRSRPVAGSSRRVLEQAYRQSRLESRPVKITPIGQSNIEEIAEHLDGLSVGQSTRRAFLKLGMKLGIGAAAAGLGIEAIRQKFITDPKKPINDPPRTFETPVHVDPDPVIYSRDVDPVMFTDYSPAEKNSAQIKINKTIEMLLAPSNQDENLNADNLTRTLKWEQNIDQILQEEKYGVKVEDRTKIKDMLLAMIYVESQGVPDAQGPILDETTGENAKGLLQLVPSKVKDAIPEIRNMTDDDFNNPDLNLRAGVHWFNYLLKNYDTFDLASKAHNLGGGVVTKAVKLAAIKADGDAAKVQSDFEKMGTDGVSQTATAYYINKYHLNSENIFNDPAINSQILDEFKLSQFSINDTYKYLAAFYIVKNKITQNP